MLRYNSLIQLHTQPNVLYDRQKTPLLSRLSFLSIMLQRTCFLKMHFLYEFLLLFFFTTLAAAYNYDYDWVARHLGARSPYNHGAAGGNSDPILQEYDLEQIQLVFRHGIRYPNQGDKEDMIRLANILKSSKNNTVAWANQFNPDDYPNDKFDMLTDNGEQDVYKIGVRMGKKYAKITGKDNVKNIASDYERTTRSANAFTRGFFGSEIALTKVHPGQDTTIHLAGDCPAYDEEIGKNPKKAMNEYINKAYPPSAERLNKDLGVALTAEDVYAISLSCAYEASIYQRTNTFCALLTKEDYAISEYSFDIKYAYKYSYTAEINPKLPCDLLKEIVADIDTVVQGRQGPRLSIKNGHSMTVLPLEARLGIHKDDFKLTANVPQDKIDNRKFRTSEDDMYGANVMFQLLTKKGTKDKFVRILLSEVPTVLPGCDTEACPYETFQNIVKPLLNCDYREICGGGGGAVEKVLDIIP
ncbi:histidine phosphatase superfamily [Fennellomyces sp. T-0311]|nr:histidine phosphatase superfamily [Fennellomyces sp. T-0311]